MKLKCLVQNVLCLMVMAGFATVGLAQQKSKEQLPEGKTPESSRVFVIGLIQYLQSEGGYFILGDHPYGSRYKIANQDPKVLEKLLKSGNKHINIEGRLTKETGRLFIEKIDGQPYGGEANPAGPK